MIKGLYVIEMSRQPSSFRPYFDKTSFYHMNIKKFVPRCKVATTSALRWTTVLKLDIKNICRRQNIPCASSAILSRPRNLHQRPCTTCCSPWCIQIVCTIAGNDRNISKKFFVSFLPPISSFQRTLVVRWFSLISRTVNETWSSEHSHSKRTERAPKIHYFRMWTPNILPPSVRFVKEIFTRCHKKVKKSHRLITSQLLKKLIPLNNLWAAWRFNENATLWSFYSSVFLE